MRAPHWLGLAACGVALALLPLGSDGPAEVPFAVHRIDMAVFGIALGLLGVAVEDRRRRKRKGLPPMLARGMGLRVLLMGAGFALRTLGEGIHSGDYWDYSVTSPGFHILGPARMMAEGSLLFSAFGLSCTAEVVAELVRRAAGPVAAVYILAAVDGLVLALLGLAGERGLPSFRVMQVVSRIGLTTAFFSVPLAIYGGRVGYWGAEPFAWLFVALALGLLVSSALRD